MGTPLRLKRIGGAELEVDVALVDSTITARIDGGEISARLEVLADDSAMLVIGDRRYRISGTKRANSILVAAGAMSTEFQIVETRRGAKKAGLTAPTVDAPMPGTVLKILVKEGARVETNDPLIVLEAMKTETTLSAESPAVIKRVCVQVGQRVDHGATLIELGPVMEPNVAKT
jgi:3-methylcrotonyl-CoA carboxylase alpha subunit